MRYFVFVVAPVKPRTQDEGLNVRITFQAKTKVAAKRTFQHYFKGLIVIDIFSATAK